MLGVQWFEVAFVPLFNPVTIFALLATLILILASQAENIWTNWIMRPFHVRHSIATPAALIGASNFFELAVAVVITLFGAKSQLRSHRGSCGDRSAGNAFGLQHRLFSLLV